MIIPKQLVKMHQRAPISNQYLVMIQVQERQGNGLFRLLIHAEPIAFLMLQVQLPLLQVGHTLRWTLDISGCYSDVATLTDCKVVDFDGTDDYISFKKIMD
jgi:hypothetical protein